MGRFPLQPGAVFTPKTTPDPVRPSTSTPFATGAAPGISGLYGLPTLTAPAEKPAISSAPSPGAPGGKTRQIFDNTAPGGYFDRLRSVGIKPPSGRRVHLRAHRCPSLPKLTVAKVLVVVAALALGLGLGLPSSAQDASPPSPGSLGSAAAADGIPARELNALGARLAPIDVLIDLSALPATESAALVSIVAAARTMDTLFLRQVWAGDESLLFALAQDRSRLGTARLHAFIQNKGPWLRLDGDRPFLPDVGEKPGGAAFYPPNATKTEIETWMKGLPAPEREQAGGFFTTIRRAPDGSLRIVPYSIEYQGELSRAAAQLRRAAATTADAGLRAYLEGRARAFETNDYRDSDKAWMKLTSAIEPTIGPYEVYEDGWFNAKAAFEAFVTIRDDAGTTRLGRLADRLQDIENHLPIDPRLRNPKLGALAPIRVVNLLFAAGDGNRGAQTAAFNLPNDEVVTRELGTKRTMLKNVQEAKFAKVLVPIARVLLAPRDRSSISFEAFFTHILMHELLHGLGPHEVAGRSVRAALQDCYSAVEEAKADVSGLFALQYLIDQGVLDRSLEPAVYTTYLASAFRSLRFGVSEAHAKGMALQINTFLDAGAFIAHADGTFGVDAARMKSAVVGLTTELMSIEAAGDRARAVALLRDRAVIRPEIRSALDRLNRVPVDIEPRFVTADLLRAP